MRMLGYGRRQVCAGLIALVLPWGAFGQTSGSFAEERNSQPAAGGAAPTASEKLLTNFVEAGGNYYGVSQRLGDWSGGYLRAVVTTGRHTWNAEVTQQREFRGQGTYGAIGDTFTFSPNWYGSLTVGSSVGGFFYPRIRADAFLNRKWLKRRQLITSLGVSYYKSKDVHSDRGVTVGTTYYFAAPWIVEAGVHINDSRPGSVFSSSQFVALTQGRGKQHYVVLRVGFGREAYQLIGPAAVLADFPSQTVTLTWRQWLGRSWGFNWVGDYYHNSLYQRGGASVGFFKEF